MDRLKGKVAVITGGNSGVGEATAKLFAKEGAVVVITARREAALTKVAEEIKAAGGEAFAVSTDISKPEDPERLMELVLKKYGKIDILINNAGILETGLKPIDRFLDEDLDRIVETNQKGTMRCMRAAARRMQSGASIVNVASVAGVKGCGGAAYVASKAAVIGVTKHTALRFQQTGMLLIIWLVRAEVSTALWRSIPSKKSRTGPMRPMFPAKTKKQMKVKSNP